MDGENEELVGDHGPTLGLLPGQAEGQLLLKHQPGAFTQFSRHTPAITGSLLYRFERFIAFHAPGFAGAN